MTTPAPHTLTDHYTLWLNADGEPIEKPLSEMTGGEVLAALRWHTDERERLSRACADDERIAETVERGEPAVPADYDPVAGATRLRAAVEAAEKLRNLFQQLYASMPQWRRHPKMKLTAAVQQFWPR